MIMKLLPLSALLFLPLCLAVSCADRSAGNNPQHAPGVAADAAGNIKAETVSYGSVSRPLKGYIAYNPELNRTQAVVLVIHEWWGLNDYVRSRARQLAAQGYFAFAVDMYGEGETGSTPDEAKKLSAPFYDKPELGVARLRDALIKAAAYKFADTSRVAAVGYCFGGAVAMNAAKLGFPLDGAISVHGSLKGVPPPRGMKTEFLVLHGEADANIPPADVAQFKKEMDAAGARYTFRSYPGATHAFSNPEATEKGKRFKMPIAYNPAADTASWNEMTVFLARLFPAN